MVERALPKIPQRAIAVILAVLLVATPLAALAQETEANQARRAAEQAATAATNKTLWFIVGCLGGVTALLVAYIYSPNPPSSALLGKSPQYVAVYTDTYKETVRRIQTKQAMNGCLAGLGVWAVLYLVLAVLSASAETTGP